MKEKVKKTKTYRIKVLDMKYQSKQEFLHFRYMQYRIEAGSEKNALKKARTLYMRGEKAELIEEFPVLLKLFSVQSISSNQNP